MIVDTSAILAIILKEPDGDEFADRILAVTGCRLSVAGYIEAGMRLDRFLNPAVGARLDALLTALGISLAPVTETQARLARQALRDYGKGTGHPAQLNFGDAFAYALARETGQGLLYKGDDFAQTDIQPA